MAICRAPACLHWSIKCPITEVFAQGSSSFGWRIREDAPAARMMTAWDI
jgi:hypothetical protein